MNLAYEHSALSHSPVRAVPTRWPTLSQADADRLPKQGAWFPMLTGAGDIHHCTNFQLSAND